MPRIILELPKTHTVKYSSKPLNGSDEIVEINSQEFPSQFQFEWHDDLLIEDEFVQSYQETKETLPTLASGYLVYTELHPHTPINESMLTLEQMPYLPKLIEDQQKQTDNYLKEVETILPHLVVCEIDPRVGNGLFWQGPETIKKGTAITCYAGIMGASLPQANRFSGYGYTVPSHPLFKNHSKGAKGVIQGFHGNHSRFIQHLPETEKLSQQFKLDSSLQPNDIATANVEPTTILRDGMPLVVFVATEDIRPNSQIGFDYGDNYWAQAYRHLNIEPLLFNKQSEILDPSNYERLVLNLNVGEDSTSLPLVSLMQCILDEKQYLIIDTNSLKTIALSVQELTAKALEELARQSTANTTFSYFSNWLIKTNEAKNSAGNYQRKFIDTVYSILLNYWLTNTFDKRLPAKTKIPYIETIMNAINDSMSADEVFLAVKKKIDYTENRTFYINQLQAMRSEIISAMKTYNTDKIASKTSSVPKTEVVCFSLQPR